MSIIQERQPKWKLAGNIRGRDAETPDTKAIVAEVSRTVELQRVSDRLELREFIQSEVARAFAAMPQPKNGQDGNSGRDGRDGMDASEIEIVENVVEGRNYPKGILGIINGGLHRSTGTGWVCLIPRQRQLVGRKIEKKDRTVTETLIFDDGFEIPSSYKNEGELINRGVYAEGKEYELGDVVTRGGSTWVVEAGVTKAVPDGRSRDWRLQVKQGAPGKDGKSIKGEKGDPGTDLRYK